MRLIITSAYDKTPEMQPKVSYLVRKLAQELLIEKIWEVYQISDQFPSIYKSMWITFFSTEYEEMDIQFFRKEDWIAIHVWIPYCELVKHKNQIKPFLKYYFEAMTEIFSNYGVDEEAIDKVQQLVEKEVIDNPVYVFVGYEPDLEKVY